MAFQELEIGPIDIVVIGFPPGAPLTGEAMPIFFGLVDRRIIRVIDVQFVTKDEDGRFEGIDPADLDASLVGDLADFAGAATGLISDDDIALVGDQIEPGGAAVMIAYENRWAAPFVTAVRRNGGVLIANERVRTQDLLDALDAAEAAA
jgi:Family of unknown function (DUF6325)